MKDQRLYHAADSGHEVGMAASIPFVGFGILDNAIMIFFGDIIDMTLCVKMGFSTMAPRMLPRQLLGFHCAADRRLHSCVSRAIVVFACSSF